MALSWVKVTGPQDRDVFVNGQYVDPAGRTDVPFRVEPGQDTFETLDSSQEPDWGATVIVERGRKKSDPQIVQLQPL